MQTDTKHRLLNTSEALFAERGFYGISIAAIAKEMAFSKQALLHHYPTKEKLYGAVLQRISDDFLERQLEAEQASRDPLERLKTFYLALATPSPENVQRTRKGFLTRSVQMVKAIEGLAEMSDEQALIIAYQWLGAVNYFLISPSTLSGIFGDAVLKRLQCDFNNHLVRMIDSGIQAQSKR
jgi:AcrR family transcriptional regulator